MKKKSLHERALDYAVRKIALAGWCKYRNSFDKCDLTGLMRECTPCLKAHFLSLAKKEMDKEKKS